MGDSLHWAFSNDVALSSVKRIKKSAKLALATAFVLSL